MAEEGIRFDSSVFPASRAHGGLPQFRTDQPCKVITQRGHELIELPMNTASFLGKRFVFSGGGYFRLLPEWYLKHLFQSQEYVMTYFHPRDFDADQPMIPGLSPFRKFKSYYGIKNALHKLSQIQLSEFTTVSEFSPNNLSSITL